MDEINKFGDIDERTPHLFQYQQHHHHPNHLNHHHHQLQLIQHQHQIKVPFKVIGHETINVHPCLMYVLCSSSRIDEDEEVHAIGTD